MNEIFLDLVESVFSDHRLIPPPPPPLPPGNLNLTDSLKNENIKTYQRIMVDFKERKKVIENDTTRLVVAIVDTIYTGHRINHATLKNHYNDIEIGIHSGEYTFEYKIELASFNNNGKYLFKYVSEFPEGSEMWNTKYSFKLDGVISFSRIYFDKKKNYGVLEGGTTYGKLNGNGWVVFIKKENEKWVIDKIEGTWIS